MLKKLTLTATLACLLIIFLLSAQTAPMSAGFSRQITVAGVLVGEQLGVLAAGTAEDSAKIDVLDNQFRQSAHSIAFFALALALVLCMVLAGLDEYHQTFVPGRGMEWVDFWSDMLGVGCGLALVLLGYLRVHKRRIL